MVIGPTPHHHPDHHPASGTTRASVEPTTPGDRGYTLVDDGFLTRISTYHDHTADGALTQEHHPMLNSHDGGRSARPRPTLDASGTDRPDLQIRSLLADPQLRRTMGLEAPFAVRPEPRFDRRRLLDAAAA